MALIANLKTGLKANLLAGLDSSIFADAGAQTVYPLVASAVSSAHYPSVVYPSVASSVSTALDGTGTAGSSPIVVSDGAVASATSSALDATAAVRGVITASLLTSADDNVDGTSFTTASVSLEPGRLYTIAVSVFRGSGTTANTPTVSGASATWVQVASVATGSTSARRLTLFRTMVGSSSSGALTIDFAGTTHIHCTWSVVEWQGVNTGGTNGSGAVVQSNTATSSTTNVTTQTATLSAFENSANMNYTCVMLAANNAVTPGTGFTELMDLGSGTDALRMEDEYKLNDTTADPTWTSTVAASISIEIKAS